MDFQILLCSVAASVALHSAATCEQGAEMCCAGKKKKSIPVKVLNYIIFLQKTGKDMRAYNEQI